ELYQCDEAFERVFTQSDVPSICEVAEPRRGGMRSCSTSGRSKNRDIWRGFCPPTSFYPILKAKSIILISFMVRKTIL
ncbi:MAG: hypothetical protein ACE5WD_13465, partial [Candidatus Aminicenantia bacterium]